MLHFLNKYFLVIVVASITFVAEASVVQSLTTSKITDEIQRISQIPDDTERLRAFDSLSARMPLDTERNLVDGTGGWLVREDRSKIDDSKTVVLSLDAESEVQGWPNKQATPRLIVRYREGKIQCYFSLGMTPHVASVNGATFTVRFDRNEAVDYRCTLSTNREAVFLTDAKEFIRRIVESDRIILRFTPYNSSSVITEFDTRGFVAAMRPLEDASGWRIDNQRTLLNERLKSLRPEFDILYRTTIEGTTVSTAVEGNSWQPWARDDGALERILNSLQLVSKATEPWSKARFRVTVYGTNVREKSSSDGGSPFTSNELASLARTAIREIEWKENQYELVVGSDRDPARYGTDAPRILRGKVKSTRESVFIEILGIGN